MTSAEVAAEVIRRFEELGLKPIVGGSFASSLWGRPRFTHDLDLSIRSRASDVDRIMEAFGHDFVISRSELEDAVHNREWPSGFQLIHIEEVFKIDVFVADDPDFSNSIESRAKTAEIAPGQPVRFFSPEDIVLMKLRWFELGHRVSDRQWNDIIQVIEMQAGQFDSAYVRGWAEHLGLSDLAEEALSEVKGI